jgi:spore photoproduct lyase
VTEILDPQICKECDYERNAPNGICVIKKASDGHDIRCVGRWAKDKYFYIGRYLDLFSTAMKNIWNLYYIDLFAGCGKCRVRDSGEEIDGSALMSLNIRFPFTKYLFVDSNPEALDSLEERIKSSGFLDRVKLLRGDCNEKVEEIIKEIPQKGSLCLAFIDPTGLQIKFATIKQLTEERRIDLIITFPEGMAIKRNLETFLKQGHSLLDDFMGDTSWREQYRKELVALKPFERNKRFVELYREKLKSIGYLEIKSANEVLIRSSAKKLPLYYLLFASKHQLGHQFWSKIGEIEPSGQQRFKFNNPTASTNLAPRIAISRPKIHYKEYQQLDGKKKILIERVNDGSIIQRFDKTPLPKKLSDVVCPHFIELKWAYGCPFDCSWCYLKGTFRFRPDVFKKPVMKDYEKIEAHTRAFLEEVKTPEILNTGEIADSLMFEFGEQPFSKFIIPFFSSQKLHKVLFLTKSSNIKNLLEIEPHNKAIISFSLNAIPVAEKWEKAPSVLERIEAAKKVYQAGYEVRIRIDPMVPIESWQEDYSHLVDMIFENLMPERITLGSLRGLQSTINGCTDRSWVRYLKESSNWGRKIDSQTRYDMYSTMIKQLEERYNFTKIALCKETVQMWNSLKMDYRKIRCNCLW